MAVYFDLLLRTGVIGAAVMVVLSRDPLLIVWAALMLMLFRVQRSAPFWNISDHASRAVFGASVLLQLLLVLTVAYVSDVTGLWLIAAGHTMNTAVILANDVRMPILNGWSANCCYREADEYTRLPWLCDVFDTTTCTWARWIVSPGDALEVFGLWALAAQLLLAHV